MKGSGLSKHLIMMMVQVACSSMIISCVVYYAWYGLTTLLTGRVDQIYQPSFQDWLQFGVSTLLSLAVAVYTAMRFARKVIYPLNSLAESARKIAGGELATRAKPGDRRLTETASLVDDFNIMAERLETTSGEITIWNAAIAHELRTPVTILRGRLKGLADGVFEPDNTLFLNLVKQTDNLARLIEDLRTLSLADSGHMMLRREDTNISREITAVAELMRPALAERKLSLVLRLDDVTFLCDGARVRQALLALLDNTRRYAEPGVVMVSCSRTDDYLFIRVEDEGPGIPEDFRISLFNAFTRGDQSRSRESGGTGLGLAVVQAIMKAHKGKATCGVSEMGGASFTLLFSKN